MLARKLFKDRVKSLREETLHRNMVSVSLSPDKFLPKGILILWVCTWVTNVITNMEESRRLNLNLRGAFFSVILSRAWNSKLLYSLNVILFSPNLKGEWVQIGQKRKFPPKNIDLMEHESTTYHVLKDLFGKVEEKSATPIFFR